MPLIEKKHIDENTQFALWDISETSEELLEISNLPDFELENIVKIKNNIIKNQKIAVRLLVHELLGENVYIKYNHNKAPLLNTDAYHISITHSSNYAAVIISTKNRPGIDIETINDKILKIENKFLSAKESQSIKNNRKIKLLLYWNAKETIYKILNSRNINYRNDIYVSPFDLENNGEIIAYYKSNNKNSIFKLNYKVTDKYTLTWCNDYNL
ncbi:MAG: hypothetical protein Kow0068_11030 [Marinilabiliales bacterium]